MRDMLTAFTSAIFAKDETASELRNALIATCLPMQFQSSSIRVDCAPALRSLQNDSQLLSLGIDVQLGDEKNPNKNPVADKAIQELELELLKLTGSSSPVSTSCLVQAVCNLNSRIRYSNLSAKEMLMGRDQISGCRLQFSDQVLSNLQNENRISNHLPSALSKSRGATSAKNRSMKVGTLVYIKHEGDKFKPRESYVITSVQGEKATLQKMNRRKFSSREYSVPLTRLFPCVGSSTDKEEEKVTEPIHSSSDDDDHVLTFGSHLPANHSDPEADSSDNESDNEDNAPRSSSSDAVDMTDENAPRRSSRSRCIPMRYGDLLNYDSRTSLPGENEVTQPWWPNHPRSNSEQ